MFHICRTIRRHVCLRQVKLCIGQRKYKKSLRPKEGRIADRSTKRVNSRSLTKLLFRILQIVVETTTTTWSLPGTSGTRDCIDTVDLSHPSPSSVEANSYSEWTHTEGKQQNARERRMLSQVCSVLSQRTVCVIVVWVNKQKSLTILGWVVMTKFAKKFATGLSHSFCRGRR